MKSSVLLAIVLVVLRVKCVRATLISNVNFAFEVFSPKSMIRFFEFNDMNWNISQDCIKNMYSYLDGLQKDLKWAYKLLDSSGNYAGGFFYGQHLRPSNPDQCYELNEELSFLIGQDIDSSNFLNTTTVVPFFVHLVNAKYVTYVDSSKREIHQTVCMPVSCSYDDLIQVMSYVSQVPDHELLKDTELVEVRVLYQNYKFYFDINFTIITAIASVMLLLNVGISLYEWVYRTKRKTLKNEKFKRNISCRPKMMRPAEDSMKHSRCFKHSKIIEIGDDPTDNKNIKSKTTNFKMNENAESLTISSKNCNHLNLVKLQKNKADNTITLDIISTNCNVFPSKSKHYLNDLNKVDDKRRNIFKFSFRHQLAISNLSDTPHDVYDRNNAIQGIRVFSLFWIILLNVTTILSYASNNVKFVESRETNWLVYLIFKNGSFSIDSYFFVSGILLCQTFFNSSRELKIHNVSRVSEHFKHFFLLVSFKVLGILLPYVTVIHSLRIAMKHFNENSIINVPSNDHFTCDNIWKNLLFHDNFGPYNERCILWTWYISLELQFFIVSLLVLMLLKSSKKFALIIFSAFFVTTFFTTTATDVHSSKLTQITNLTDEEKLMHFNGIFDHPLVHLGPYLVGILFGIFAQNYEKKVRIHSALVYIGWITSVVLFALLMLSSYKIDNVDPWLKQSFATISHTFWSLVLLWICFASMAGCGGWLNDLFSSNFFQVISRISNSMLLIHPLVTRVFILSSNNAIFVSAQLIVVAFFGFAILSIAFGLLFYVIFEAPVLTLLNIIYERLVEKSKNNNLEQC